MQRIEVNEDTCEISNVTTVSFKGHRPVTFLFSDEAGNETELWMDDIGANALRIAIGSLKNIPPLVLPKSNMGELQCTYPKVHYKQAGDENAKEFEKELEEAIPLGRYDTVEDGMLLYLNGPAHLCFDCKDSALDKEQLVLVLPDDILESMKLQLDKIFPFQRFSKINRLSYGYFKTSNGKKGEQRQ